MTYATSPAEARRLCALLADTTRAQDPGHFPVDRSEAAHPGLYAWWADDDARTIFGEALRSAVAPLIYAGQAGATKQPSGKTSSATLLTRIGGQHLRGNVRSSTFRQTISALLRSSLGLKCESANRLTAEANRAVTRFIYDHLRVVITSVPDRDHLSDLEAAVVGALDPPLNLNHVPATDARQRLSQLRMELRAGVRGVARR